MSKHTARDHNIAGKVDQVISIQRSYNILISLLNYVELSLSSALDSLGNTSIPQKMWYLMFVDKCLTAPGFEKSSGHLIHDLCFGKDLS